MAIAQVLACVQHASIRAFACECAFDSVFQLVCAADNLPFPRPKL